MDTKSSINPTQNTSFGVTSVVFLLISLFSTPALADTAKLTKDIFSQLDNHPFVTTADDNSKHIEFVFEGMAFAFHYLPNVGLAECTVGHNGKDIPIRFFTDLGCNGDIDYIKTGPNGEVTDISISDHNTYDRLLTFIADWVTTTKSFRTRYPGFSLSNQPVSDLRSNQSTLQRVYDNILKTSLASEEGNVWHFGTTIGDKYSLQFRFEEYNDDTKVKDCTLQETSDLAGGTRTLFDQECDAFFEAYRLKGGRWQPASLVNAGPYSGVLSDLARWAELASTHFPRQR